ncbi:MAG: DUF4190 domain-containing protein [Actinomycetota bacterium]
MRPASPAAGAQPAPAPPSIPPASAPVPSSPWLNTPPMRQPGQQPIYQGEPQTDGKATGSLILGILSLLCFSFFAGIPAIILGHISRKNIRQSMGRLKGDGMALAGLIMGYISIAFIPVLLIIAAIVIPNLLRAKLAANDAAAASVMRTINTAQVSYKTSYPNRGYARDLSTLGSGGAAECGTPTENAACLIDASVTRGERYGYHFSMTAVCGDDNACTDYLAVATPVVLNSTGTRSFCSTSDAVIHSMRGAVFAPSTPDECQAWPAL